MIKRLGPRSHYVYATLILVTAIALLFFAANGAVTEKEVSGSILALFGTFLGALFAFRLNESKERDRIKKDQKAALNRALFILIRQYNAVKLLLKELEPFKTEFDRAFNLPAIHPPPYADLIHNFVDLEFLIEAGEPNLLMNLTIEQECFHQTFESIRRRHDFHVGEIQPTIARLALNGKASTPAKFRLDVGERIFGTAVTNANTMYSLIQESHKSIAAMHTELFVASKKLFPDDSFVKMAPKP